MGQISRVEEGADFFLHEVFFIKGELSRLKIKETTNILNECISM